MTGSMLPVILLMESLALTMGKDILTYCFFLKLISNVTVSFKDIVLGFK